MSPSPKKKNYLIKICPLQIKDSIDKKDKKDKYDLVKEQINNINSENKKQIGKYINFGILNKNNNDFTKKTFINISFDNYKLPIKEDYLKDILYKRLGEELEDKQCTYHLFYFVKTNDNNVDMLPSFEDSNTLLNFSKAIVSLNTSLEPIILRSCEKISLSASASKNTIVKGTIPKDYDKTHTTFVKENFEAGICKFPWKYAVDDQVKDKCKDYHSSRINAYVCATKKDKETNVATKLGVCDDKKTSLKSNSNSKLNNKSKSKANNTKKNSIKNDSGIKESKNTMGKMPEDGKYDIKHNTFVKDNFKDGNCKFPWKYAEDDQVKNKCKDYYSSRVKAYVCATEKDKDTNVAKKLGVCGSLKCFDKNKYIKSMSDSTKNCYISDEINEDVHRKSYDPTTVFNTNDFDQWYPSQITPNMGSTNRDIFYTYEEYFPYVTIGDGNCLFHSIVGSFQLQITDGIKKLKEIIKNYETEKNKGKKMKGDNLGEKLRSIYVDQVEKRPLKDDIMEIFHSCEYGPYINVFDELLLQITPKHYKSFQIRESEIGLSDNEKISFTLKDGTEMEENEKKKIYVRKLAYIKGGESRTRTVKLNVTENLFLDLLKIGYIKKLKDPKIYCDYYMAVKLGKELGIHINVLRRAGTKEVLLHTDKIEKKKQKREMIYIDISHNGSNHFEALGKIDYIDRTKPITNGIKRFKKTRKQNKSSSKVSGKSQKKKSSPSKPKSMKKKQHKKGKKSQKKKKF